MTAPDFGGRLWQLLGWTAGYVGVLFFCSLLDVALWRKFFPAAAPWLAVATAGLSSWGYLLLLDQAGLRPKIWENPRLWDVLSALGCALLFYLILDRGLDPLLDGMFPQSGGEYAGELAALGAHPVPALLRVCVIAPVMEETLTRGLLLGGLREAWGLPLALGISVGVFALLHFNLAQTLSAVVCGLVLGALYLGTGSLFACVLAHAVYNLISFLAALW